MISKMQELSMSKSAIRRKRRKEQQQQHRHHNGNITEFYDENDEELNGDNDNDDGDNDHDIDADELNNRPSSSPPPSLSLSSLTTASATNGKGKDILTHLSNSIASLSPGKLYIDRKVAAGQDYNNAGVIGTGRSSTSNPSSQVNSPQISSRLPDAHNDEVGLGSTIAVTNTGNSAFALPTFQMEGGGSIGLGVFNKDDVNTNKPVKLSPRPPPGLSTVPIHPSTYTSFANNNNPNTLPHTTNISSSTEDLISMLLAAQPALTAPSHAAGTQPISLSGVPSSPYSATNQMSAQGSNLGGIAGSVSGSGGGVTDQSANSSISAQSQAADPKTGYYKSKSGFSIRL